MVLTGKITLRKRGESDSNYKRFKKSNTINPFFLNSDSLFIPSLILFLFLF